MLRPVNNIRRLYNNFYPAISKAATSKLNQWEGCVDSNQYGLAARAMYIGQWTTRAHSFRGAAEKPAVLGFFPRYLNRGILPRYFYTAEFDVFHSNNYFFTENDLKVVLLQVCLWWFFIWWWWLNDENDD